MEFFRVKRLAHFFRKLGNIPNFATVKDHRKKRGRRWEARSLFTSVYLSMLVGKTNFRGAERLTEQLRLWCFRYFATRARFDFGPFLFCAKRRRRPRQVLVRQIRSAERRKALEPTRLPINLIAIDGKTIYYGPKRSLTLRRRHPIMILVSAIGCIRCTRYWFRQILNRRSTSCLSPEKRMSKAALLSSLSSCAKPMVALTGSSASAWMQA